MKSTGTTSWFHRDIPSARSPYTSTTWEDTKRQFVIESQHLGFDNKREVNNRVTREARMIPMTSAIPQEERRDIKVQSVTKAELRSSSDIASLSGMRHKYLTPAANPQSSSMSLPTNAWPGAAPCSPLTAGGVRTSGSGSCQPLRSSCPV